MNQLTLRVNGFDAEAYWRKHKVKKWVVVLTGRGKRNEQTMYVQAGTKAGAIACAKRNSRLTGRVHGVAWLASPWELGAMG